MTDRAAAGDATPAGQQPALMVIPRRPGPLREVDEQGRPPDDLDELVDELFGPSPDERPGLFDAVLFVGGLGLLGWCLLAGASVLLAVVAIVAIALGAALPARGMLAGIRRREEARRRRRAIGNGQLLDVSDRATNELARAYGECVEASVLPGVGSADEAVAAAHQAVLEVATLLDGGRPIAAAQRRYVTARTAAIEEVTDALLAAHRRWLDEQAREAQAASEEVRERATAIAQARDELELADEVGALRQLHGLAHRLKEDAGETIGVA